MSSVVTGVFKLTVGMLWTNVRDYAAERLQDGDLTDQECRKLIIRSMVDLKSKLTSLSRKDLLSSTSFLKEGASILSLDSSQTELSSETAPVEAFNRLQIVSDERVTAAKECFKTSREDATRAFNNTSLSIEDRVLAMKLRVTARIFESHHDPDIAGLAGETCLRELHQLQAIQEIFSVSVKGGIKGRFNKALRHEIAVSVLLINLTLFNFTKTFTKVPLDIFNWPKINVGGQSYHPILGLKKDFSIGAFQEFDVKMTPFRFTDIDIPGEVLAVNSKKDLIIKELHKPILGIKRNGKEAQFLCNLDAKDTEAEGFRVSAVAIDQDDNVFVITSYQDSNDVPNSNLTVVDDKGNITYQCPLSFLKETYDISVAVSNDRRIFISAKASENKAQLYICNSNGELQSSFLLPAVNEDQIYMAVTGTNDILTGNTEQGALNLYTEQGESKRKLGLPENRFNDKYKLCGAAFNFLTKTIIVLTREKYPRLSLPCYFLISYSEVDDFIPNSFILDSTCFWHYDTMITSHPNGIVAVISERGRKTIFL